MKLTIHLYRICKEEYILPQNLMLNTDSDRAETAETAESAGIKCQQ